MKTLLELGHFSSQLFTFAFEISEIFCHDATRSYLIMFTGEFTLADMFLLFDFIGMFCQLSASTRTSHVLTETFSVEC